MKEYLKTVLPQMLSVIDAKGGKQKYECLDFF